MVIRSEPSFSLLVAPQVELEEEGARERQRHAREVAQLRATIDRLQEGSAQRRAEGDAAVAGMEAALQSLCEQVRLHFARVVTGSDATFAHRQCIPPLDDAWATNLPVCQNEEKEAALRKAAKEVASLRADCARLGQAAERWQEQHELLAAAADHAASRAAQQCDEQAAALETAHRAQAAALTAKVASLETALEREREIAARAADRWAAELEAARATAADRARGAAEAARAGEAQAAEAAALSRRLAALQVRGTTCHAP